MPIYAFIVNGILGGVGLAIMTGLLGCFLLWRRLVFLGDVLAHASLLGISLGIFLKLGILPGVIFMAILITAVLGNISSTKNLPQDTWLGLLSYGCLALGLIFMVKAAQKGYYAADPQSYLLGDLLLIDSSELIGIWVGLVVVSLFLKKYWAPLLLMSLDEDFAYASHKSFHLIHLVFMGLISLAIALAIKVVGVLLVPALLIIPPSTAHLWARTPEKMALFSVLFSVLSVILGFGLAWIYDIPTGPAMIMCCSALFLGSFGVQRIFLKD